ncbi:hypothetical protein A2880_02795 [Candidatus Peribacteria bacterium RIFCSPHIGHO2_01_FULL_49_38]|nr:MAG: hypothetical protein A2880_02795 [Candidatus Peribacteria bacterium RIFCSPHIGHO2_01_FULL_49_38]
MNGHSLSYYFHTIGRYWAIALIGILIVWGYFASADNSSTQAPLPAPVTQTSDTYTNKVVGDTIDSTSNLSLQAQSDAPAVSLPTGTILKKRSAYLQGYGELEIKNGTNEDAVAKLIRDGTSVLTIYIKANSTYTMKDVSDGTYWLAFAQGIDWDADTKTFSRNVGYSSFEETFDFVTTDSQYTIFEVTLNPVVGGTAETETVDASQFNAY